MVVFHQGNKSLSAIGHDCMMLNLKKGLTPALSIELMHCLDYLLGEKEGQGLVVTLHLDARARFFTGKCLTHFLVQDPD